VKTAEKFVEDARRCGGVREESKMEDEEFWKIQSDPPNIVGLGEGKQVNSIVFFIQSLQPCNFLQYNVRIFCFSRYILLLLSYSKHKIFKRLVFCSATANCETTRKHNVSDLDHETDVRMILAAALLTISSACRCAVSCLWVVPWMN
jgi:hypothetical protein